MKTYSDEEKNKLISFGLKLKQFRLGKNLSQEELAGECDLHRTYISSTERGERNLSLINIIKISEALGITPSELLEGVGE